MARGIDVSPVVDQWYKLTVWKHTFQTYDPDLNSNGRLKIMMGTNNTRSLQFLQCSSRVHDNQL